MAESSQSTATQPALLVHAQQVAREADVRQSPNGVRFATFGETGVLPLDLERMLEAVPTSIAAALGANTYFFVPLALREAEQTGSPRNQKSADAMIAPAYTDELGDAAICHRNVELDAEQRGVFISTRLMNDRFALCFEFFINVAHAFVDEAGVPEAFAQLAWEQATANVRGETSFDAWESRHLAFGRTPQTSTEAPRPRRERVATRTFTQTPEQPAAATVNIAEKERTLFLETAFSDALAIFLLSLALDFDYTELREREYPLLAPAALAARLRLVAELFPPNPGYEFAIRYRRRA